MDEQVEEAKNGPTRRTLWQTILQRQRIFLFLKKEEEALSFQKVRHTGVYDVTAAGIDLYFPPLLSKKNVGADGGTVRPPTAGMIGNFGRKLEI